MGAPGLAFETWDGRITAPDPVRQTPNLFAPFTKRMGLTNAPAPRSPPQPGCPTLAASLFLRLGWGWPTAQPHRSPQPGGGWPRFQDVAPAQKMGAPGLAFETWDGRITAPDPVRQTPNLLASFTKRMGPTNAPAPRSPPQPGCPTLAASLSLRLGWGWPTAPAHRSPPQLGCPTLAASLSLRLGWGWPTAQPHRSPQPGAPASRVAHNLEMHKKQNYGHWVTWETTDLNGPGGGPQSLRVGPGKTPIAPSLRARQTAPDS